MSQLEFCARFLAFTIQFSTEDLRIPPRHAEARTFLLRRVIVGGAKVSDRATGVGEMGKRENILCAVSVTRMGDGVLWK